MTNHLCLSWGVSIDPGSADTSLDQPIDQFKELLCHGWGADSELRDVTEIEMDRTVIILAKILWDTTLIT